MFLAVAQRRWPGELDPAATATLSCLGVAVVGPTFLLERIRERRSSASGHSVAFNFCDISPCSWLRLDGLLDSTRRRSYHSSEPSLKIKDNHSANAGVVVIVPQH